jgi:cytochrome P450
VLAMVRQQTLWAALGADPSRAGAIVEETLRHDPPVQLTSRVAGAAMEIGGTAGRLSVPKGDIMMLLLAGAQRDPLIYNDPNSFNPGRGSIRHLAFGLGPHFCLGAPLARLEATIALSALTAKFPQARLDREPVYKPNVTLRGMSTLSVTV